jgi:PAS domain S-box-containing protein
MIRVAADAMHEHAKHAHSPSCSTWSPWVESLGVPVWITHADGLLCYLNPRAEALFGHSRGEGLGRPCHVVVAGRSQGSSFCGPHCRVRTQAAAGSEIEPIRLEVTTKDGARAEVCVVVIAVDTPEGRQLVHVVLDDERERRIRGFLEGITSRAAVPSSSSEPPVLSNLTSREREILSQLAVNASLDEIADRFSLSHATVRNHVQHILAKLGVHSTLQAVAVWLLEEH